MKKITFLIIAVFLVMGSVISQNSDPMAQTEPIDSGNTLLSESNALFDLLFINNIAASTNSAALTGVLFMDGVYWFSRWNTNDLYEVDIDNNLIEAFTITGITGTRTFTTDGTNVYIATAEDKIYVVDPATKTLINTIDVTSSATVRMLTYDENLDNGNGGFWIGSFENRIIASVDMNGNELRTIPGGTHLTRPYDGVVDYTSEGGPYLWVHEFGPGTELRDFITQIDMETGQKTGIQYNFEMDAPAGTSNIQAGGLFLTDEVDPDGKMSFLGVCQSFPNLLFAVELAEPLAVTTNDSLNFSLYPNPAQKGEVFIKTTNTSEKLVSVYDVMGREILRRTVLGERMDISELNSGVYLVQLIQDELRTTRRLIVNK
ncbi:MAG: T9SS type A sorting domain-containing protein [Bacteroidota bacterium]